MDKFNVHSKILPEIPEENLPVAVLYFNAEKSIFTHYFRSKLIFFSLHFRFHDGNVQILRLFINTRPKLRAIIVSCPLRPNLDPMMLLFRPLSAAHRSPKPEYSPLLRFRSCAQALPMVTGSVFTKANPSLVAFMLCSAAASLISRCRTGRGNALTTQTIPLIAVDNLLRGIFTIGHKHGDYYH